MNGPGRIPSWAFCCVWSGVLEAVLAEHGGHEVGGDKRNPGGELVSGFLQAALTANAMAAQPAAAVGLVIGDVPLWICCLDTPCFAPLSRFPPESGSTGWFRNGGRAGIVVGAYR